MPPLLRLLRPKQWTKNVLVFAAFLFTAGWRQEGAWVPTLIAFCALCALSSASYAWNDANDVELDRQHPQKSHRPVASGAVSVLQARVAACVMASLGVGLALLLPPGAVIGIAVFAALQAGYNLGLKRVPVLDLMVITLAFVMRATVGALATEVAVSGWLLFCTGALALMLITAKRRQEFLAQAGSGRTRSSLVSYNQPLLDALVVFGSTLSALSYGIYAIESATARAHPALMITVPVVLFGVLRYLLLVYTSTEGEEPESVLFRDPWMLGTLALFVVLSVAVMAGLSLPFVQVNP